VRRRVFTLACSLSLLLFAATVVLWVRSYQNAFASGDDGDSFRSGRLELDSTDGIVACSFGEGFYPEPAIHRVGDFGFRSANPFIVFVPHWAVCFVTGFGPVILWLMWYLRPLPFTPLCPNCSYNLTGNTSGACPECGTAIAKYSFPPTGAEAKIGGWMNHPASPSTTTADSPLSSFQIDAGRF
jgi:hypothetical protein